MSQQFPHRFVVLATLIVVAGSGCAIFQRDEGPIYRFARRHRAKDAEITNVSLKLRDRRPDWERKYHRPFIDPKRKQLSVELLAVNNFDPNPIEQLKLRVGQKLAELDEPPTSAEVVIKRLHVVVKYTPVEHESVTVDPPFEVWHDDDIEDPVVSQLRRDDAYLTKRKKWEQAAAKAKTKGVPPPPPPKRKEFIAEDGSIHTADESNSLADTVASHAFVGLLNIAWISITQVPSVAKESIETIRFYSNQGPPPDWAKVDPGVTCHIEGFAKLKWTDGHETNLPINVKKTERYAIDIESPSYEVAPFLADMIGWTAVDVAKRAAFDLEQQRSIVPASSRP